MWVWVSGLVGPRRDALGASFDSLRRAEMCWRKSTTVVYLQHPFGGKREVKAKRQAANTGEDVEGEGIKAGVDVNSSLVFPMASSGHASEGAPQCAHFPAGAHVERLLGEHACASEDEA